MFVIVLDSLFKFFLFLLVSEVTIGVSPCFTDSSLSHVLSNHQPIESILHLFYSVFTSWHFVLNFYLSANIILLFLHVVHFSTSTHGILILVCLNSQSHTFSIFSLLILILTLSLETDFCFLLWLLIFWKLYIIYWVKGTELHRSLR